VGAASDIERATQIAHKMVTQFGMSSLGPITYGIREEAPWVARDITEEKGYSQEVAAKIDAEIKKIIDKAFAQAKETVTKHRKVLDIIVEELMKKETLEGPEFEELVNTASGKKKESS